MFRFLFIGTDMFEGILQMSESHRSRIIISLKRVDMPFLSRVELSYIIERSVQYIIESQSSISTRWLKIN